MMVKKQMIFLIGLFLYGCHSCQDLNLAQEEALEMRSGTLTLLTEGKRNSFKCVYTRYGHDHYKMAIYPFLFQPIIITVHSNELKLQAQGECYYQEAAKEYLNNIAPSFPWEQMIAMMEEGHLRAAQWSLEEWSEDSFKLANKDYEISWAMNQQERLLS